MDQALGSARIHSFGVFEFDPDSGELRKRGMKVKLQGQPIEILALLLERPGQIVTREELQKKLWPADTFVDFEHSLNAAVKRLRDALDESAEKPLYIETLARRGYRLIVPVNVHDEASKRPRALKAFASAAVVVLVLLSALFGFNARGWRELILGRDKKPIQSLAVLPVKNLSGDPAQDFFADGMTDGLVAGLAQIKAIKVISRTSVMHYKGTTETVPQIAKELNVDGILEVSLMRSADRLRVTAQLIDARQDRHLWANNYDRDVTDVLILQSDLVQTIAAEIKAQITPQETALLKAPARVDPEVYEDTTRGNAILEYTSSEKGFRQAIELFQKAADRDPTYAPAWAGLGEAQWSLAGFGLEWVAPAEVRSKATAAADRALELDQNLPEAHKARALIAIDGDWDLEKAQRHFERALQLRPGYAAAHNLYAQILTVPLERLDEARLHLNRARELDPLSPWNDFNLLIWRSYQEGPEGGLEEGQRLSRQGASYHHVMGDALLALGQLNRAVAELEADLKMVSPERPVPALSSLGLAYGLAGRRADAVKILNELEWRSKKGYISPYYIAIVCSGLGQMEKAFRLLDQALAVRSTFLIVGCARDYARDYYETVVLRRDPRWKSFIERFRREVRLPPGTPDPYS